MTLPAVVGRDVEAALRLLSEAGEKDVLMKECLPPEDKRPKNSETRVLRAKRVGETVVLTVSPFETRPKDL